MIDERSQCPGRLYEVAILVAFSLALISCPLLAQESSFPVHHDGNWLLQTCKSEDAYTSGECYGYIYATMDEFHVRPSSPPDSGIPFFCIPERTSPSDWKKMVVDFLVRYPENRTKYQAVELIGMALCSSWPFAHLGAAKTVNLQYAQTSCLLIEADRNLAQTEQSNLERLDAKQKRFRDYAKDFVNFAEFAHHHSDTLEVEVAWELNKIAAENDERIGAMMTLLTIHENVHCKDDLAGISPLLRFDFDTYGKNIGLDIESVNLRISSTQSPGVDAEATRMRDDLSEIRSILDSIKLESSVWVIPDGSWLLQTCKSEDAYTSGECYGYIYTTMDRFYWENGGAGTPFFCFPKPTSPSDLKKTVVDFLVRYPEERTKYESPNMRSLKYAVELVGLAISNHWPCRR